MLLGGMNPGVECTVWLHDHRCGKPNARYFVRKESSAWFQTMTCQEHGNMPIEMGYSEVTEAVYKEVSLEVDNG